MSAVGAETGVIDLSDSRPLARVQKGYTYFGDGDVLFAKITPCMENGKVAIARHLRNGIGFGSTEFHVLRPERGVDERYLFYFLTRREFRRAAKRNMTGTAGQLRVPTRFLETTVLPLPPILEQQRIIEVLESLLSDLDAAMRAQEQVLEKLKRYRRAVLRAAVEGELSREWRLAHRGQVEPAAELLARVLRERRSGWEKRRNCGNRSNDGLSARDSTKKYREPFTPYTTKLKSLSTGWHWASVDQVSSVIVDCPHSTARFLDKGRPCIDTTCIKPGEIVREKLRYVSEETYRQRVSRLVPQEGDIVFAREGTVGTAVVVPSDLQPCLGQRVMLMRSDSCIIPAFFQLALDSSVVRDQCRPKLTGSTVNHLNVADVKQLAIPLPPLAEQEQIILAAEDHFSIIEHVERSLKARLCTAQSLRQSILDKAFRGKLVPQHPDDEPATILLQSIRAKRATVPKFPPIRSHKARAEASAK
jgi:type I restriction enzyme S subunit